MRSPNAILRAAPLLALICCLPLLLSAQTSPTGVVEGRVLNTITGDYIESARVSVAGTTLETLTDKVGQFRIANVPAGAAQLTVSYTGFGRQTRAVNVVAGDDVQLNFELSVPEVDKSPDGEATKLDTFKVLGRALSAEAAALNDEKNAGNIKNVVTFGQFGEMGEGNPAEYLKYIPGLTVAANTPAGASAVVVRGMPSNGTVVLIDGAPATSASGDRAFSFQSTPASNIARMEVNKSPTPDIPANSIGGSINVVKKSGFSYAKPQGTINAFMLFNVVRENSNVGSILKKKVGSNFTALPTQPGVDISYIRPVNKSLAFTFNAGLNRRFYDVDVLQSNSDLVLNQRTVLAKTELLNLIDRRYVSGLVDYKFGKYDTLTTSAQYTKTQTQVTSAGVIIRLGTGAITDDNTIQSRPGAGALSSNSVSQVVTSQAYNLAVRYLHDGPIWRYGADVAHTSTQSKARDISEGFFRVITSTLTGLTIQGSGTASFTDGLLPNLTVTNSLGQVINPYDESQYPIASVDGQPQLTKDRATNINAYIARDIPLVFPLKVKVGISHNDRTIDRTINNTTFIFTPPGGAAGQVGSNYDLVDPEFTRGVRWRDTAGQPVVWKFVNPEKMYDLYKSHPEYFVRSDAANYASGVNNSKLINELITAAYVRLDAKLLENKLNIVTGVRFEETADKGLGPLNNPGATYQRDAAGNILLDSANKPILISTDPLVRNQAQYTERGSKTDKKYSDYYPSVNASFAITNDIVARASYAKTLGRPSMNEIIPGVVIPNPTAVITGTPTLSLINSGLKPWSASNYDFSVEAYNIKSAVISVGVFQKDITNFFEQITVPATPEFLELYGLPDEYLTYNIATKRNGGDARLRGLEWSYRQKLFFLPKWAQGFDVFANATYVKLTGTSVTNFVGYTPRTLNFGIGYTGRRLVAKVNVSLISKIPQGTIAPNATTPAGTLITTLPAKIVDASVDYKVTKRLSAYVSARNLASNDLRVETATAQTPDLLRRSGTQRFGIVASVGLKCQF